MRLTAEICDEIIAELRKGWKHGWGQWRNEDSPSCLLGMTYRVMSRHEGRAVIPSRVDKVVLPTFCRIITEQYPEETLCQCSLCEFANQQGLSNQQKNLVMHFNDVQDTVDPVIAIVEKVRANC